MKRLAHLLILILILTTGITGMAKMEYTIHSSLGTGITAIPLDEAHQQDIPGALQVVAGRIPTGSFLLRNDTHEGVTVVVAVWSYMDAAGAVTTAIVNCDGYLASPAQNIVQAHSATLITPNGCTPSEYFVQLANGQVIGSSLNEAPPGTQSSIVKVDITIDAVILENGSIRGSNDRRYTEIVRERYEALQEVLVAVDIAQSAGEPTRLRLRQILDEARAQKTRRSNAKSDYANLLLNSPNISGTLQSLKHRTRPPQFRQERVGDQ